jgi:predicted ATP-grasp superfamily ATP-dependent carboligase
MDSIRRFRRPSLRRPIAIVAFEGWNDACDAASAAAAYVLGEAGVIEPFAAIDPEEFFDFQAHRPLVELDEGGTRSLSWPLTRFYAISQPSTDRDLVVVAGDEPSFRWRTFTRHITQVLSDAGVEEVVLLGAFIGQVAHTRPTPIVGVATDPAIVRRHRLPTSTYEGPTGIIGVLMEACREAGLPAVSLWAAVPHYLAANPNPKAALALLERAGSIVDLPTDLSELELAVGAFNERVDRAVRASRDFSQYVGELEEEDPESVVPVSDENDPDDPTALVTEIEDFLRDQR